MDRLNFLNVLNAIEGFKTVIKAKHWNELNPHKHQILDDLYNDLNEYQDEFAEEGSIIFGRILPENIKPIQINTDSDEIDDVHKLLKGIHNILGDDVEFAGLLSITDDFLHKVSKYKYLANMTKIG
jgi:hypothetical protein